MCTGYENLSECKKKWKMHRKNIQIFEGMYLKCGCTDLVWSISYSEEVCIARMVHFCQGITELQMPEVMFLAQYNIHLSLV